MTLHQQTQLQARLIKLSKEEERAQKRIRDAEKRSDFLSEMHHVKAQKMHTKMQYYKEMKDKEDNNRMRINHHRMAIKSNINSNKESIVSSNNQ